MKINGFYLHRLFYKSYARQLKGVKKTFVERRNLLLIDPDHPLLNNHPLHGKWNGYFSINVTGDVRAVYKLVGSVAVFFEIGDHSYLYK